MSATDTFIGLCLGVGLSAACGLRVFLPMLILSVVSHLEWLDLAQNFQWLGTPAAMLALTVATLAEVTAYFIPWLDNALDSLAGPAAVLAGTLITASQLTQVDPLVQWSLALIAGGGTAGVVQGTTTVVRAASTATTGGVANPLLASLELGGSLIASMVTLLTPVLMAATVLVLALATFVVLRRRRLHKAQNPTAA